MVLYYDDKNAECSICGEVKSKTEFSPKKSRSKHIRQCTRTYRGVHSRCRNCREILRKQINIPDPDDFWNLVNFSNGKDACWPWMGRSDKSGYGVYSPGINDQQHTHRVSYFLSTGNIKHDSHILHSCDNPICCNPEHLREGTYADNVLDKIVRGRQSLRGKPEKAKIIPITVVGDAEFKLEVYQILKRVNLLYADKPTEVKNDFLRNVMQILDKKEEDEPGKTS